MENVFFVEEMVSVCFVVLGRVVIGVCGEWKERCLYILFVMIIVLCC